LRRDEKVVDGLSLAFDSVKILRIQKLLPVECLHLVLVKVFGCTLSIEVVLSLVGVASQIAFKLTKA